MLGGKDVLGDAPGATVSTERGKEGLRKMEADSYPTVIKKGMTEAGAQPAGCAMVT